MDTCSALVLGRAPAIGPGFCQCLSEMGLHVDKALSADAALLAAGPNATFDLLVTTIYMPGSLNGLSFATVERRRRPQIKIILIARSSASTYWLADAVFGEGTAPGKIVRQAEELLKWRKHPHTALDHAALSVS